MRPRVTVFVGIAVLAFASSAAGSGDTRPPAADAGTDAGASELSWVERNHDPKDPLNFGAGMTRPELISGKVPKYSPEAVAAGVRGSSRVSCVVTLEGRARDCQLVQLIRFRKAQIEASRLEQEALTFLEEEGRFKPATFKGRPQAVNITFLLTFNPPSRPEDPAFVVK